MKKIKIAYIGGGSKQWARFFMTDLALIGDIEGEIALYDIDKDAAIINQKIGNFINNDPKTISKWNYVVYDKLEDTLLNSDYVVISILPGTFEEMRSDVHAPEKYGIYQAVGDTVGPGGVLRAMRTVPIYEYFAKKIKEICPNAWVMNLTNPMSICTKTLYEVFPEIKAFGCCHEVFHAQDFLCLVASEELGIKRPHRKEIYADACGVNHFTWIAEARYKDVDLLSLLPSFMERHYNDGIYEKVGSDPNAFKSDCFAYGNKVKMNFYKRYNALAAAGDRHLVEFVSNKWYLNNDDQISDWKYLRTTVDFRVNQRNERVEESLLMSEGKKKIDVVKSDEEVVDIIKALEGHKQLISNVNMKNVGQIPWLPLGSIVETNCIFSNGCIKPIVSKDLPIAVKSLVSRNCLNIDALYEGITERDLDKIFASFIDQPLCSSLTLEEGFDLFKEMVMNTREYLDEYFLNLDEYFN